MVQWLLVLTACGITLLAIYGLGGRTYVSRYGLPVLLILVALPWPSRIESTVVQSLTSANARLSVDALNLLGIPVVLNGENLLQFAQGSLRIDDACSGIRSLYLAIALGFFWGALYRIEWIRRVLLVVAAVAAALLANLCRNLILGIICQRIGQETMEQWHNVVGIGAQAIFLAALWWLVVVLERRGRIPATGNRVDAQRSPAGVTLPAGKLTVVASVLGFLWLGAVEGLNEWWYRSRATTAQARMEWDIAMPVDRGFQKFSISKRSKAILRPDEHRGFVWQDDALGSGLFFYLHWNQGSNAAQHAQIHRPEICLPAVGFRLVQPAVEVSFRVADRPLTFRRYKFEERGQPVFVFHGIWSEQGIPSEAESESLSENWSQSSRIRAAWFGRRQSGQRVLEAAFWDAGDLDTAHTRFQDLLDRVIESPQQAPSTLARR